LIAPSPCEGFEARGYGHANLSEAQPYLNEVARSTPDIERRIAEIVAGEP
jgi:hypothetical protein